MLWCMRASMFWVWLMALLSSCEAQIMSVDLGHEFFKVALMRQGVPLEIVLNEHSKRKSSTAVSFFEGIRVFGDDALGHQGKAPSKVPMFFHSLLGQNFTSDDVKPAGEWWAQFGLGDRFYSYVLSYADERGTPAFKITENATSGEEVLASILHYAKKMAEESSDGKIVKDVVLTVPSNANMRQRQAIVAAAEIAGLRVLTLVHEGSAFAVQRAVDYQPEKGNSEIVLFYNLGSRKAEVSIAKFESRSAGMVAGKTAPVVTVLGSAIDFGIGGHLMDLKIADVMLKKFQEKHTKLADGVVKSPRALRKLLSQSQKTKAILSSNKVAPFIVESLFEDTDFQATIKREEFEGMCKDMLDRLTDPIEKALAASNLTMKDIQQVEVVGGAWRVPKVQQVLSTYFEQSSDKKMLLGQHLNGEEAAALGAALVAANASSSFRVKKIFFTDISMHEYAVQVASINGSWEKNVTVLYPKGAPLGGKKKLAFSLEEDFVLRIFEDGLLLSEYTVTGLEDVLNGKWKEYNVTGPPKISATVPLETSGLIEFKTPTATVEEAYYVNVTKEKPNNTNTSAGNMSKGGNSTPETAGTEPPEGEANASENGSGNLSISADEEVEVVQKLRKKKHDKKLSISRKDFRPLPLSVDQIAEARKRLEVVASKEAEVLAVAGMKNELEASIYNSREKMERDDILQVSTEQQREEITKLCSEYEDWMYESGATKSDYETRLTKLQDLLGPMEERAQELDARADLPSMVKEEIADMRKIEAHVIKNMSWVPANKTEAAKAKLDEFEVWWTKKHEQQGALPLHEAPAFTKKEVVEQLTKLQKEWDKLKKTKKPKDKPKTKDGKNSSSNETAQGSTSDTASDTNLPTDVEATQSEIDNVREKKANAVENEDFDSAHALKQREQVLVKHLESLKSKSEL